MSLWAFQGTKVPCLHKLMLDDSARKKTILYIRFLKFRRVAVTIISQVINWTGCVAYLGIVGRLFLIGWDSLFELVTGFEGDRWGFSVEGIIIWNLGNRSEIIAVRRILVAVRRISRKCSSYCLLSRKITLRNHRMFTIAIFHFPYAVIR